MNRDDVVGAGDTAITNAQYNNAVSHAIAACDVEGTDTVADGVVDDPRQCTYTAAGDPTITCWPGGNMHRRQLRRPPSKPQAIDKIWDGPRNHDGRRIWHPWQKVIDCWRSFELGTDAADRHHQSPECCRLGPQRYDVLSENLYSTRALATANPLGEPSPIALEDEFVLGQRRGRPGNLW